MARKLKINLYPWVMLVLIGITFYYNNKLSKESKIINEIKLPNLEQLQSTLYATPLYYPNKEETKLISVETTLSENLTTTESILKDILSKLILKLESDKLIPKQLYSYEVYLKDRTLYLDLDPKIFSYAKNAKQELFLVYSFVNSLLAPGGGDEVVLLIGGKSRNALNFITLSKSYKMNMSI